MFDTIMIGKKIAELRKQKNMTQSELADAMGVSFQAVSNWERGNSMPDISKLAELTEILGTTIDELLGKKNSAVERLAADEDADMTGISRDEIAEAAEIAKPRTLEKMAEKGDAENIKILLPFLSDKFVSELAAREYSRGKDIVEFLPFLDDDNVDELLRRALADDDGARIRQFLPFATEKAVANAAAECREKGSGITVFLPFLSDDDLEKIAFEALEKQGLKGIGAFLPFLNENAVDELASRILKMNSEGKKADE